MAVCIEGYTEKYYEGVVNCLRRNYPWMAKKSQAYIAKWIVPVLTYHWVEDIDEAVLPHKYGTVLLDGENVVGFLGTIYSRRYAGKQSYIFLRPTTWAIDEKYRIYLFKVLKMQFAEADVIGDFAPRESVEKALVNVFHVTYCDQTMYKFAAVPHLFFSKVDMQFIQEASELRYKVLVNEYQDNALYGVKCVDICVRKTGEHCVIFYQLIGTAEHRRIQVMKVSQPRVLADFAHEILWKIQHFEKAYYKLKCDSRFFGGYPIHHPFYKSKAEPRLLLNKLESNLQPQVDFLYSDTCMLEG